jgi:hypothetical protein
MIKYIIGAIALILFTVILVANQNEQQDDVLAMNAEQSEKQVIYKEKDEKSDNKAGKSERTMSASHSQEDINCKYCHMCDYPTVNDPCLSPCPREVSISVYHTPEEGPEIVTMDEVKGELGPVIFSHKIHAQMSVMSGGCESCHHYNTTGPVLQCKNCHSPTRIREDITIPDLEAAYHRQCIDCHRQWSGDIECNFCHIEKGQSVEEFREMKMKQYTGIDHPAVHEPVRVIYETDHEEAPIVTFFHDEHAHLFNLSCQSCHHDENCSSCHHVSLTELHTEATEQRRREVHKTFEQHHQPCNDCHETDDCSKCHMNEPMEPFDHKASTGFALEGNHAGLKCVSCHQPDTFKGLNSNCSSCHNFESGDFDHKSTGFALDDMHSFFGCSDCHKGGNYAKTPVCTDCHDGYKFPDKKPGRFIK